ncbi:MAG: hypothetical protein KDC83_09130 [Flavobacteriales bacterium]|nr:hypothetical protein [Flavobacteriales bacterium]
MKKLKRFFVLAFKMGRTAFLFYLLVYLIIFLLKPAPKPSTPDSKITNLEIEALLMSTGQVPSQFEHVTHNRCWEKPDNSDEVCLEYSMNLLETTKESKYKTQNLNVQYDSKRDLDYWEEIYGNLYRNNPEGIAHIVDSLSKIATKEFYSPEQLAKLVVSFIQDLPYWYILDERRSCDEEKYAEKPCVSGIKYGLLSPLETAYTAFGDCDSKALLLYCILRQLNFEPIIVTSNQYHHAMIAINLISDGDFIMHRGKRFYFWETTMSGWQLGMLPPPYSNKNYWNVALSYEY